MKRHILLAFSSFVMLLACSTAMAQSPTNPALGFNVFLQNGGTLINNETEGPVAMGGDLTIGGGYQVSINNPGTFKVGGVTVTLVIGGKVIYQSGAITVNQNGYVKIGDCTGSTMWYTDMSGAYSPMRITPSSDYNSSPRINMQVSSNTLGVSASTNPICQGGLIDFASAFTQMKSSSSCIATLTDNTVITKSDGTVIPHTGLPNQVKINLHTGTNVLNITGSDFNNVTDWIYNTSPDASHVFVINVTTPASFTWQVPNSGGIGQSNCPYILYNFPNATSLSIAGNGSIEGTIFAPFADVTKSSNHSNVEGQVIAQSYYHASGENHYANFLPTISGCSGVVSTAAGFTINNSTQCLIGNSFTFTNTSTGTTPITYAWDFGNGTTSTAVSPVVSYTTQGTYSVTLTATGAGGVSTVIHTVSVLETPPHSFTINNSSQALTGNSFVFTSTAPTAGKTYTWSFGDGATSTVASPAHSYTATGNYLVGQTVTNAAGCSVYSSQYVSVVSDGVSGGGGGGLESVSLCDLVTQREYNKMKNNISNIPDYKNMPVFEGGKMAAKGTGVSVLQKLVPASLDANTTAQISTPTDLTSITSAVDVFSLDYTANNFAKAVVLGVTTQGHAYNHTKSICDRFRGAVLSNTNQITIQGYNFIQFTLRQSNGDVEYCIAFAAGKSAGSSSYDLQSNWLISEYAGDDSVFNFQVWAAKPDDAVTLANTILNNLKSIMPVQQTDVNFKTPTAYMTYGKRNEGFLDINIACTRNTGNAKVIFIERINELANTDTLLIPFNLVAGADNKFSLPVHDGYEYEGHLYFDDSLTDDTYMADGNWSLDYDKNYTTLTNYKPNNNFNRVYTDGEYPVYRSVQVNASTADYMTIYKFITSGEDNVDLTSYHSYKFFAKGTGTAQVRLLKNSITKWADQYYTEVTLDPAGKYYSISFNDFTADHSATPFKADDIRAIVYTCVMNGKPTDFSFFADEQSFSPTEVTSVKALSSKNLSVYPNPSQGTFQVKFAADADRDMTLDITDISGRIVYTQAVHATAGFNTVSVTLPVAMPHALLMAKLHNKDIQYDVVKVSILH